jgi:hypothetical protein
MVKRSFTMLTGGREETNGNAVSATHYAFTATASTYHPSSRREITLLDK